METIIRTVGNHKEIADEVIIRQARIDELKRIADTTGVKGISPMQLNSIITKLEEELALFVNKSLERIELETVAYTGTAVRQG